jgi:DNA-binding GntR family transcriptional regulator
VSRRLSGERLVRRSSGEDAARYIQRLIFDGELRPGARVPQDDIAQALGISRIPVREALIALERAGWVTIELHRGAFVSVLDEQGVRDHYDLHGIAYGLALRRAIARAGPKLDASLPHIVASLRSTTEPGPFLDLVNAFDDTVLSAARSPRIEVALRALSPLVPGNFFQLVPAAMQVQRTGITTVAAAIARRDGDGATVGYREMMRRQADNVAGVFRERGVLSAAERVTA